MEKVMRTLILLLVLTSTILIAQETKIELPTDDNTSSFTVTGANADRKMVFFADGGFYMTGENNEGTIPISGAGGRFMWFPGRRAFRTGYVDGAQWNDDNIGRYSIATGSNTTASGVNTTAMGHTTTASGDYSTAMGGGTIASGEASTAMGLKTTASGDRSTAMGYYTIARGEASTAMGLNTTASGGNSSAMGYKTTADGDVTVAMGHSTAANGYCSTAMGYSTTTSGNASTAMGNNTTAQAYASLVIGQYNYNAGTSDQWVATDPVFEVGVGTSSDAKANALTVLKNGNVGINNYQPDVELHVRDQWTNDNAEIRITAGLDNNARLSFYQGANRRWFMQNHSSDGSLCIYNGDFTHYAYLSSSCDQWRFASVSDIRRKENIEVKRDVLKDLLKLDVITFNYTTSQTREIGLIAQEVKKYFPEIVNGEETDSTYLSVVYSHLTPILLQGIKELKTEKDKEIEELQKLNKKLTEQLLVVGSNLSEASEQYAVVSKENKNLKGRIAKLEKLFEEIINNNTDLAKN